MKSDKPSFFPWWLWIWIVHIVFVGILYTHMLTSLRPDWFRRLFPSVSLGSEENYAVWWSGVCLFIAASLFYRLASLTPQFRQNWHWLILGLIFLALGYDEIGSLHEVVSTHFGWIGLAPFALVFGIGFCAALYRVFGQPGFRLPGFLIALGIFLFAAVASLEFVEHNMDLSRVQRRYRLVIEEGTELIGMTLVIIAGLICLARLGVTRRRLSELIGDHRVLTHHYAAVFGFYVLHFVVIVIFAIPFSGAFSEGSPAAVFPIFLFYILFLICLNNRRSQSGGPGWLIMAVVFLFSSLAQIHNFNDLLVDQHFVVTWGLAAPDTWLVTLIPLGVAAIGALVKDPACWHRIAIDGLVLTAMIAILYADHEISMVYYLYSSTVAFLCYRWITAIPVSVR